jgi:hypothetical protein
VEHWLDVVWLCVHHHRQEHVELKSLGLEFRCLTTSSG